MNLHSNINLYINIIYYQRRMTL